MTEAFLVCSVASASVLSYGFVLSKYIPRSWHAAANSIAAIVSISAAWLMGLSLNSLGLSPSSVIKGSIIGLAASLLIIGSALLLASLPFLRSYFLSQHSILKSRTSLIVYETVIRIPLVTALFEEVIFRAFLLGVFMLYMPTAWAIVLSSVVFGLWHISPSINSMNENHYKSIKSKDSSRLYIGANVLFTTLAGIGFCLLRIMSGSIAAPWLVHWSINAGGVVGVLFARGRMQKNLH